MKFILNNVAVRNIMKNIFSQIVIAILFTGISFAEKSNAQAVLNRIVSISMDDARLSSALKQVEKDANIKFVYSRNVVNIDQKISIKAKDQKLGVVLDELFNSNGISYEAFDNRIVLSNIRTKIPVNGSIEIENDLPMNAKVKIPVTGKVTDRNGEPLIGVSVKIKGTNIGASTDVNGQYSLNTPDDNSTLVFTYIGYITQEISVNNQAIINISLKDDAKSLDEVVVVGYGTQSKRNLTSSIGSVSMKDLGDQPVQQVGQVLQGKIAGVQIIQNSGSPGSALMIRIRGTGTVNNSEPLYVIDGNLGASPSDLDPNQIESVDVLKSASAAAIYGAQGANGVVVITTKKGVAGTSVMHLNMYTGIQEVHRTLSLVNAREYATIYNKALTNAGKSPLFQNVESLGEGTDWQDAIFRTAPILNLELSASGGTEKGRYYISGGYFKQNGTVINTDFSRINFRVNSEYKVKPALTIGENLGLSYGVRNDIPEFGSRNPVPNSWHMDPSVPVKNPDGTWGFPKFSDTKNPVAEATLYSNTTKVPRLNGSVYLDFDLLSSLKFRSQLNMNLGFSNVYYFNPTYDIFPLQRNLTTSVSRNIGQTTNWDWQNTVTFDKAYGSHNIEILGGVTAQSNYSENVFATGQGVPLNANTDPNLRYLNLTTTGQQALGGAGEFGMLSFLGRANYSFKGKYLFTGNFRVDGSSKFGSNNRFGAFPSFSLGWRVSDEGFMKNISFIDDLKLRGGWGMLGNQNSLPNYAFANSITPNLIYVLGESISQGQAPTSLGNPDLKWETTKESEIGLDFTGFGNRVSFSASFYNKSTSNMLLRVPIPAYTGVQTAPFVNGGDVNNKGVELLLVYRKPNPGKFFYDVSVNFSKNINKVTKLSNSQAALFAGGSRTVVGESIGVFYGYVMDGIFQTAADVSNHPFQTTGTAPGDVRFKDLNSDNKINQADRTTIGNPWPKGSYGLSSNFRYNAFDLNLALNAVYGNDILANWKYFTQGSNFYNKDTDMLNAWNGEGTSNTIPRLNVNDPNDNMRASSYYIEDGTYLRLQNVQLGYTYPHKIFNKAQKLRLYLAARNLITLTKYRGFDPEIGSPGSTLIVGTDEGYYPQPRIFTAGLNLSF